MPVINEILIQHHDGAAMEFWTLTGLVGPLGSAHYRESDVRQLLEKLEASLDGLRIAVRDGWDPFDPDADEEAIEPGMPGEYFPLMVLALESEREEWLGKCLEWSADEEAEDDWAGALSWVDWELASPVIHRCITNPSELTRRAGVRALIHHRKNEGNLLSNSLEDVSLLVQAAALRGVGEIALQEQAALRTALESEDAACRFEAARSLTLLGHGEEVFVQLDEMALTPGQYRLEAALLRAMTLSPGERKQWITDLSNSEGGARIALQASGYCGDPILMDLILSALDQDDLAAVAGEAFSMITGADLEDGDLDRDYPDGHEFGPSDDEEDDVSLDEDEDLPLPHADRLREWWSYHCENFQQGNRYLCGDTVTEKSCREIIAGAFQRQRYRSALELKILQALEVFPSLLPSAGAGR